MIVTILILILAICIPLFILNMGIIIWIYGNSFRQSGFTYNHVETGWCSMKCHIYYDGILLNPFNKLHIIPTEKYTSLDENEIEYLNRVNMNMLKTYISYKYGLSIKEYIFKLKKGLLKKVIASIILSAVIITTLILILIQIS